MKENPELEAYLKEYAPYFSHLDKLFWPEGLTKLDVIKYYLDMSPYLLPLLQDRPFVMKRYPDGIQGEHFYQKEAPSHAPPWVHTWPVYHRGSKKTVNYVLCNDAPTLAWLVHLGCLEIHAWLSRKDTLEYPDFAVVDLDPAEGTPFPQVIEVALLVHKLLKELGLKGYPKTSGSRGMHVFIPIYPRWTFREVTMAVKALAQMAVRSYPRGATLEHNVEKRRGKVYLDYLQNVRGRSMAFPYSLRALPGAPVSAPLSWEEVEAGGFEPLSFNYYNIKKRMATIGDLWSAILEAPQSLDPLLNLLKERKI